MGTVNVQRPQARVASRWAAFDMLATSTPGPQTSLTVVRGVSLVQLAVGWSATNSGQISGNVGMRLNLQIDSALGDVSQLIVNPDGTVTGPLASVVGVSPNYPWTLAPGAGHALSLQVSIPASNVLDKQGSVTGFNWWIAETEVWDLDNNTMISRPDGSEARDQIRNWWKAVEQVQAFIPVAGGPGQPTYSATVFP